MVPAGAALVNPSHVSETRQDRAPAPPASYQETLLCNHDTVPSMFPHLLQGRTRWQLNKTSSKSLMPYKLTCLPSACSPHRHSSDGWFLAGLEVSESVDLPVLQGQLPASVRRCLILCSTLLCWHLAGRTGGDGGNEDGEGETLRGGKGEMEVEGE